MAIKLISGCQTGVDRAVFDIAYRFDIPVAGFVPKGFKSLDPQGVIPVKYRKNCKETDSSNYLVRTEKNIRFADATLVIGYDPMMPSPGTTFTINKAKELNKPCVIYESNTLAAVADWIKDNNLKTLNVAGPRDKYAYGYFVLSHLVTEYPRLFQRDLKETISSWEVDRFTDLE
jgi:hypothetical protein